MSSDLDNAELSLSINDIRIHITGPSSQFSGKDLYTAAIVGLIDMAHTDYWEKDLHLEQMPVEVTPAEQFYASILSAIARHYAVDGMLPQDMSVASILFQLIGDLVNRGRLSTIIREGSWGEEDGEVYEE